MADDTPVLDTLLAINVASIERCNLAPRDLMIARIAALIASDAPPLSYMLNAGTADDAGISLDDIEGILVAVAPIVGTPSAGTAIGHIARAFGFAEALEEQLAAELDTD